MVKQEEMMLVMSNKDVQLLLTLQMIIEIIEDMLPEHYDDGTPSYSEVRLKDLKVQVEELRRTCLISTQTLS